MKERAKTTHGRTRGVYLGDDVIERTAKNGRALGSKLNRSLSFSEIVEEALNLWNTAYEKHTLTGENIVVKALPSSVTPGAQRSKRAKREGKRHG